MIINAEGRVLGRLASYIAKHLLEDGKKVREGKIKEIEEIIVVNAEKVIITGSKEAIMERYFFMRTVGTYRKGPFYPRMPHKILKRTVRGMLPYQKPHGRKALKALKVHIGIPNEYSKKKFKKLEFGEIKSPKFMELGEISIKLGAEF